LSITAERRVCRSKLGAAGLTCGLGRRREPRPGRLLGHDLVDDVHADPSRGRARRGEVARRVGQGRRVGCAAPPGCPAAKATASRLRRDAYLYIRQSTFYQVANNTESTARQYDLRGRATALGWPAERIHVIDIDQGHSGAHAADREGFQHLVAEVFMGRAGIVLGLECSRLARNNADWQRLLEICAHTDTLICDEDGLYDPTDFNDRLLLGLKGTMSEAELHFLRSRLRGGSSPRPAAASCGWPCRSAWSTTPAAR
jgi:hypothetical protein